MWIEIISRIKVKWTFKYMIRMYEFCGVCFQVMGFQNFSYSNICENLPTTISPSVDKLTI